MKTNQLVNRQSLTNLGSLKARSAPRIFNPSSTLRPAPSDNVHATDGRIKNIVVPLDGSPFAEHAIPIALGIAEQSGATVHFVHAFIPAEVLDPYDALHFPDASLKTLKLKKQRYLSDVVQQLSAVTPAFVSSSIIDGRAVSQSVENIHGIDADLVVMATHGRGALGRFWSGSAAHAILQQISVPLILVRGSSTPVTFAPVRSITFCCRWTAPTLPNRCSIRLRTWGCFGRRTIHC